MLTIFTPTYNRKHTLNKLYDSLCNQTAQNFEWLIVDDGSTDNTKDIVENWTKQGKIPIRYIYQENQGKSAAHNIGVLNSNKDYFCCVDSDDYLSNDAVEEIINGIKKSKQNSLCIGVVAYKKNVCDKNFKMINASNKFLTSAEIYNKYKYKGELLYAHKTELLKNFLFPKFLGEKFVPEDYLFDCLDNEGRVYLINKVLYHYEYLMDGYSQNMKNVILNNINGYCFFAKNRVENSKNLKNILRGSVQYNIACFIQKKKRYKGIKRKFLIFITYPIGAFVYLRRYRGE